MEGIQNVDVTVAISDQASSVDGPGLAQQSAHAGRMQYVGLEDGTMKHLAR